MRTTVSIDDDVLIAVEERAAREKRSVGDILSELARAALSRQVADQRRRTTSRRGFSPLPPRGPVVTNTLIDELRDEEAL